MTGGVLVPVGPTSTLEETVSYAVRAAKRDGETAPVHLVRTVSGRRADETALGPERDLVERAERRANEAAPDGTEIRTAVLGADRYVAGPVDHVELYVEYAADNGLDRVVLDPNYSVDATSPVLQSIETVLSNANVPYEVAPVAEGGWQPTRGEAVRAGVIAVVAYAFYVGLGGVTYSFALTSGVVTALLAAVLLRNVTFEETPRFGSLAVAGRTLLFVPYLLWEITKANVLFAYIVLHPSLPIDPGMDRVEAALGSGPAVTAFANSITLTPGTLTVDASGHYLLVHSLTEGAHDDVAEGVHERAVRYLFYGREGLESPEPGERGDVDALSGPAAREPTGDAATGDAGGAGDE